MTEAEMEFGVRKEASVVTDCHCAGWMAIGPIVLPQTLFAWRGAKMGATGCRSMERATLICYHLLVGLRATEDLKPKNLGSLRRSFGDYGALMDCLRRYASRNDLGRGRQFFCQSVGAGSGMR